MCYTRDPCTGEKMFSGEYLASAEGDDLLTGTRMSVTLDDMRKQLPVVYDTLAQIETSLEKHYKVGPTSTSSIIVCADCGACLRRICSTSSLPSKTAAYFCLNVVLAVEHHQLQ